MTTPFLHHRRSAAIAILACAAAWAPWASAQTLAAPALVVGNAGYGIQSAYALSTPQWRVTAQAQAMANDGGLQTADHRANRATPVVSDSDRAEPLLTALPHQRSTATAPRTVQASSAIPSFGVVAVVSLVVLMLLAALRQARKPPQGDAVH